MAADQIAPLAVLPLTLGARIVAEALDPTTFGAVTGVVISAFTLYVIDTGKDAASAQIPGPYMLVPGEAA